MKRRKNYERPTIPVWLYAVCWTMCAAGCTSEVSLDDHEWERQERRDERSQRMHLRILSGDDERDVAVDDFTSALTVACYQEETPEAWQNLLDDSGVSSGCRTALWQNLYLPDCRAQFALELSEAEEPVVFEKETVAPDPTHVGSNPLEGPGYRITVGPQLPEARIALARYAADTVQGAVVGAGRTLRYRFTAASPPGRIQQCDSDDLARTVSTADGATSIAAMIVDAMTAGAGTIERALAVELRHQRAVADAELSRSSSPSAAASLSWSDAEMSRASFVRHLFGGNSGPIYGYEAGEGVCAVEFPDEGTREAVTLLRALAVDPREVLDLSVSVEELVMGGVNVSVSLSARQAELLGDEVVSSSDEFFEQTGTTSQALQQARRYLREEARAFSLQPGGAQISTPLSPVYNESGEPEERAVTRWSALANEPEPPPPIYFVGAAALASESDIGALPFYSYFDPMQSLLNTLAFVYDSAADGVRVVASAPFVEPLPVDARRRLQPVVDAANERMPLGIQVLHTASDLTAYVRPRGEDYADPAKYRIVRGVSGLRCAVYGNVQGGGCDLDDYTLPVTASVLPLAGNHHGVASQVRLVASTPAALVPPANALPQETAENDFVYIVYRQSDGHDRPGVYEAVGVHRLDIASGTTAFHYAPDYVGMAADTLGPASSYCTLAAVSCAGPAFADTIPLENEISGDDGGNGIENSWQYWLNLAQQSSDAADLLGEQMLTAGSAIDDSIERVEDSLSTLCGGPVDFRDAYFEMLNEPPPGPPSPGCPTGYVVEGANCVRDIEALLSDPRFETLKNCLSSSNVVDYVAVGSRPLCAWTYEGTLCGVPEYDEDNPMTFQPCPWVVSESDTTCADMTTAIPMGATMLPAPISQTLRVFETDDPQGLDQPPPDGPFDCRIIRRMRNSSGEEYRSLAQSIVRDPEFSLEEVRETISRIGYRAMPDDYGQITLDGSHWRGLGLPGAGAAPVTEWPCNVDAETECSGDDSSLFCTDANGLCTASTVSARHARAYVNHRMARAVLAMKMLTGTQASNVELPFRPEPHLLTFLADRESSGNDLGHWRWTLRSTSEDFLVRGGRSLAVGDAVNYYVSEHDSGSATERAEFEQEGRAFCMATGDPLGWLWTSVSFDAGVGYTRVHVPCSDNDDASPGHDYRTPDTYRTPSTDPGADHTSQAVVFRSLGSLNEITNVEIYRELWNGMGGQTASAPTARRRVSEILLDPSMRGVVYVPPTCSDGSDYRCRTNESEPNDASHFTNYWTAGRDSVNQYNDLRMFDDGITAEAVIDGLELVCEVRRDDLANPSVFEPSTCGDWDALADGGISNLRQAQKLMLCIAHEISSRGETQVFQGVPEEALDVIRGSHTIPGTRGEDLSKLAQALIKISEFPERIASQLRTASSLMRQARIAMARNETRQELNSLERKSTRLRESMSCLASSLRAVAKVADRSAAAGPGKNLSGAGHIANAATIGAAVADCTNSIGQIVIAGQRAALQDELSDLEQRDRLESISLQLGNALSGLQTISREAQQQSLEVRGALARLESQRLAGLQDVADALTTYGNTSAPSTLRRRSFNTRQVRYQEAHARAIGTAWLARRALEQRLGRNLSSMEDDMALVESPSDWADELCTMSGINYQRVARDYDLDGLDHYAGEYVGDYVRRLRAVFDSYSVDHPFVVGDDRSVVSLRDDVVHARTQCETEVRNLLAYSGELNVVYDPSSSLQDAEPTFVWRREGCQPFDVTIDDEDGQPIVVQRVAGCVQVSPVAGSTEVVPVSELASTTPWDVVFGGSSSLYSQSSVTNDSRVAQTVSLQAGSYRLSWRGNASQSDIDPRLAVGVQLSNGSALSVRRMDSGYQDGGWDTYYLFFDLGTDSDVDVVVFDYSNTASQHNAVTLQVGAFMLENTTAEIGASSSGVSTSEHVHPPMPYIETQVAQVASLPVCEDVNGDVFRTYWSRDCTRVCVSNLGSCEDGRLECFWELPFTLTQDDLEHGGQLAASGFANGNYNYRWQNFAVNIVGSNVQDCSQSPTPSSCYSNANIPFSLYHDSGFVVRNRWDEPYEAPLDPGRIEHARALAAERSVSNPVSGADGALLEPYTRHELRGRPLAGTYRLRLWESSGFQFGNIEDVQVVLGYRFWTQLN